ncbi:ROK family protein [Nocardia sp. NBC_00511]|uniref:ROK family protein n=1 Tax=Nocardia sp. NBC_00511 TaxID=2903591 RepID=UPI002F9105E7
MTILALEIGTTDFAVSPVRDDVDVAEIRRAPLPRTAPWDVCRDLLLEVAGGAEVSALGIACGGAIDMAAGMIAPSGIPSWRAGFGVVEAARVLFPQASVQLGSDGLCLALAERTFGATAGCTDSLALRVSDTITGGITIGGFVLVGRTGNAGNFGHLLIPGFDESCDCGGRGCLAAVASGASASRWARERGWHGDGVADLINAADVGNGVAIEALSRAGTALGRAIASAAALLDVELVALGGTLPQAGGVLWKPLRAAVVEHAKQLYLPSLRVVSSEVGEIGVIAGAGVLALSLARG